MRIGWKRAGLALGGVALALLLGWSFGPREGVDREISFDASVLGDDPEVWLEVSEQRFADIRPGHAKRIIWAGNRGQKTPLSVVYVHGFTAGPEEIRPVPDSVAKSLGANLYFTRLSGHGRAPEAMAEAKAGDWIEDMAEAMAIGRSLGEQVVVIATSTGGTLAAIAATDPQLSQGLAGVVLVSPNFALHPPWDWLIDAPFLGSIAPLVFGSRIDVPPLNAAHEKYWHVSFPSVAIAPVSALMREAAAADFSAAHAPLLLLYAPQDRIVDPVESLQISRRWGGPVQSAAFEMQPGDDPWSHVLAGDTFSPGQTERMVRTILDWLAKR